MGDENKEVTSVLVEKEKVASVLLSKYCVQYGDTASFVEHLRE